MINKISQNIFKMIADVENKKHNNHYSFGPTLIHLFASLYAGVPQKTTIKIQDELEKLLEINSFKGVDIFETVGKWRRFITKMEGVPSGKCELNNPQLITVGC